MGHMEPYLWLNGEVTLRWKVHHWFSWLSDWKLRWLNSQRIVSKRVFIMNHHDWPWPVNEPQSKHHYQSCLTLVDQLLTINSHWPVLAISPAANTNQLWLTTMWIHWDGEEPVNPHQFYSSLMAESSLNQPTAGLTRTLQETVRRYPISLPLGSKMANNGPEWFFLSILRLINID